MPFVYRLMLIGLINFMAAFIQASSGFGYALVAMAAMPLFLPMPVCSAISAVTVAVIGLQMTLKLRGSLQFKTIVLPVACIMLTVNLGLYMLTVFEEFTLRVILAGLLMVVTLLFFYMRRYHIVLPDRWYTAAAAGLLTGVSTGMFNIVGPFLLVYYMNVCKDTLHMKASLEFSFLLAGLYSGFMHLFVYQNITVSILPEVSAAAGAALAAGVLGLTLYKRINKEKLALLIYILLPIMAVVLIVNGLGSR